MLPPGGPRPGALRTLCQSKCVVARCLVSAAMDQPDYLQLGKVRGLLVDRSFLQLLSSWAMATKVAAVSCVILSIGRQSGCFVCMGRGRLDA
jgi:hypothetical protein